MRLSNNAVHRPILFWAGPGTIRMNKTRFHAPLDAINEEVHLEAYEEKGVRKLSDMGINIVYATFDWGFSPEIEKDDWQYFKRFTDLAHQYKMEVFAYIQSSNIVWKEWFELHPESKGWICISKEGKPFIYHKVMPERYYCCYNNSDWVEHRQKMAIEALDHGADGIYYDNIYQPESGCFCSSCKTEFRKYLRRRGLKSIELEEIISKDARDLYFREWCRFRCEATLNFHKKIREVIDERRRGIPMTSNTGEIVGQNKVVDRGIDISEVIKIEDLWLTEPLTLPRIENAIQISNVRTYKVAKAYARNKLVTSVACAPQSGRPLSGICSEVYPTRQYKLGIAEANACGGSLIVKGTEYFDKYWTLITEDRFKSQQEGIKQYNEFLAQHNDIYSNVEDTSNIGLVFHLPSLTWKREKSFPSFCGFFQTLHQTNTPFEILSDKDLEEADFRKKKLLILPNISCMSQREVNNLLSYVKEEGRLLITGDIATHKLDGASYDTPIAEELLSHKNVTYLKNCPVLVETEAEGSPTVTETTERDETPNLFSYFQLPKNWAKIKDTIIGLVKPSIEIKTDLNQSVFIWKKSNEYIAHVVNYDSNSTHEAKVVFPRNIISIEAYSPDKPTRDRISFKKTILVVKGTETYDVITVKLG